MRKKKLTLNTFSSFVLQVFTVIYGLILPRLIISQFGSETNGLIHSIKQFLSVVSFLELGMGAVVPSALYKPLNDNDEVNVSKILKSSQKFFSIIGKILIIYVFLLIVVFPLFVKQEFSWIYIALLIVALSMAQFSQYLFGITDSLLLTADQAGYIQYFSHIIAIIINTVLSIVLIKCGAGIHLIQFSISAVYLIRPILIRLYINHHYLIDRKITYDEDPLKQKWNGFAQHIAAFVLDGTDIIVLTLFSSLSAVSVYSAYQMVVMGIKQLFISASYGFQSLAGQLWAAEDKEKLNRTLNLMENLYHILVTFVFGCSSVLIVPFVTVYTFGVNDANYNQPVFAVLILIAYALYCTNSPNHIMILATGHFKQTQWYFIASATVNLVLSIILVNLYGLIGVAIGTLVALAFQSIWMSWYNIRVLKTRRTVSLLKRYICDFIVVIISYALTCNTQLASVSWYCWIMMSIKTAVIWGIISFVVNFVVYIKDVTSFFLRENENKTTKL